MTASRIWPCLMAAAILAGCPTPPLPAGNLADPSALAVAQSLNQNVPGIGTNTPANLVFIAEADGEDLRAFEPCCTEHLFVRGPNDITALSIPLSTTLGSTTLPSFRAVRMAGGASGVPAFANRGYLVVAGTANRLAVIDTQYPGPKVNAQPTFPTTVSTDDVTKCSMPAPTPVSVSCLPQPALDVVTTATNAYALLGPDPATGAQSIIVMTPSDEVQSDGNTKTVLSIGDPTNPDVLTTIPLPAGQFTRLTASTSLNTITNVTTTSIYLADMSPNTTTGVTLIQFNSLPLPSAQTVPVSSLPPTFTALPTPGPVRVAVGVPPYTLPLPPQASPISAAALNGNLILAVLANGSIETIDGTTKAPALDGAGFPILPTSFGPPSEDIVFMTCTSSFGQPPCTAASTISIRTGTTTLAFPNPPFAAMVALGDGTAAPMMPNFFSPQVFQPIPLTTTYPTTTVPTFYPLPAYGSAPVVMSTPTNFTEGYTRSEEVTAEFNGSLPGFQGRPAAFAASVAGGYELPDGGGTLLADGGFVLTDPAVLGTTPVSNPVASPASDAGPVCVNGTGPSYNPINCAYPLIGDHVRIQSTDWASCPDFGTAELVIVGYQQGALLLDPPNPPLPCTPQEIAYDALADADPVGGVLMPSVEPAVIGSWTVYGSASGYLGRASTVNYLLPVPPPDGGFPNGETDGGFEDGGPLQFTYYGTPFYEPENNFVAPPSSSVSFSFTLSNTGSTTPLGESDVVSFSLAGGFGPLIYSSTASVSGYTASLAVVNQTLYMAVEGADSLTEIAIPSYTLTDSENDYR